MREERGRDGVREKSLLHKEQEEEGREEKGSLLTWKDWVE